MMKKLIILLFAIVMIILILLAHYFKLDVAFIGVYGALISYIFTDYQKRDQRSFEMKKAIYFEASKSLSSMKAFMANISTIDLKTISADVNLINGLEKLHFIAKVELIEKLNECYHYYQIAIQEMIIDRLEIDLLNIDAQYSHDRSSEYLESMKMQDYKNSNYLKTKFDNCLNYYSDSHGVIANKKYSLIEKSIQHITKFNNLLSDCILIMREDIGNGFNENDKIFYKKLIVESGKKTLESELKILDIVRKKVENQIKNSDSLDL
jgi:hypothetical protein